MKALLVLSVVTILLCGCASPDYANSSKLEISELGTIAILPFEGYRGKEFVRHLRVAFVNHGATVVDLEEGKVPDGVDHVVSGKLINRASLASSGAMSHSYLYAAYMDVLSTSTKRVIARAGIDSETTGLGRVQNDNYFLPDTANHLLLRLREVED